MTSPGSGSDQTRNANVVLTADTAQYQQSVQASAQQTSMLSNALTALSTQLDGLSQRAGKRLLLFSTADFAGMGAATAMAASFQKQLSVLQTTATVTNQSFSAMKNGIQSTFQNLPVARDQVTQLATALTQLGQTAPDQINKLTQTFIKLGAATGEGPTDLASGLTQLSQLMGTSNADQITKYANSLLVTSRNAGVAATGVLNFANAIAPLGRQAGLTEAQIMGIGTAFTKAGADGMPAFNALNSLMSDITQEIQTGSPQIAKFANLIGVSAEHFKKMDGASRIVDIFNAIGKAGPKGVQILNQLGLEGIRTQSAIAAVTQTGELQKYMGLAVGSQHDTNMLDRTSKDAMSGMSDQLQRLRNQFTQLGTDLGNSLLPVLQTMARAFADVMNVMVKVEHFFSPLIDAVGTLAGAFGGLGGAALLAFGVVSKLATLKLLATGSPIKAFTQGMAVGRNPALVNDASVLAANGALRWYNRPFYYAGQGTGALMGQPDPNAPMSSTARARNFLLTSPLRGTRFLVDAQRSWLQASTTTSTERLGTMSPEESVLVARNGGPVLPWRTRAAMALDRLRGVVGGGAAGVPSAPVMPSTAGMSAAQANQAIKKYQDDLKAYDAAVKAATASTAANTKVKGADTKVEAENAAEGERQVSAQAALGAETRSLTMAFVKLGGTVIATGVKLGAQGVAMAGSKLWQALGPIGTALIALPMLSSLKDNLQNKAAASVNLDALVNPIQQMNDTLGIANKNLATFANNLANANSTSLADSQTPVTWKNAALVSAPDLHAAAATKPNAQLQALGQYAKNDPRALREYIQSLDLYDPRQLQLAKQQALAAGFSPDVINKALRGITQSNTAGGGFVPDFSHLLKIAYGTNGNGVFATNPSGSGNALLATILSAYGSAYQSNRLTQGNGAANAQNVMGIVKTINKYLRAGAGSFANPGIQIRQLAAMLNEQYGQGVSFWNSQILSHLYQKSQGSALSGAHSGAPTLYTYTGNTASILNMLSQAPLTKDMLKYMPQQVSGDISETNPLYGQRAKAYLAKTAYEKNITDNGRSALGTDIYNSSLIRSVSGESGAIADPAKQARAIQAIMRMATQTSGAGQAALAIQAAANRVSNGQDPNLLALEQAARTQQQQNYMATAFPTMSMGQQTNYLRQQMIASRSQYLQSGYGQDVYQSNLQAYQSQEQANLQYAKQMYTTVRDYNTQTSRSYQDYHKQVYRSERDFHIQMQRSEKQFQTSRYRQTRDFNIQLEQQNMQAAQNIYNPYLRVFSQQTASADETLYNLQDQNRRIIQQRQELSKLRGLGLDQKTIDVLDLSNPQNAQELNALYDQLAHDPKLIKALNKQAAERVAATKALTQSSFSYSFRQETAQFHRGFMDMAHDFHLQQTYAKQDEQRGLSDMAYDFDQMLHRSADDMKNSLTQVVGSFGSLMARTFRELGKSINKYAPEYAKVIQKNLDSLRAPNLGPGGGGGGSIATGRGAFNVGGPLGSRANPITKSGVMGLNPSGQYGHYGPGGKFFEDKNVSQQTYNGAQHIASPKTGHLTPSEAQAYARSQLKHYGWGGGQMGALTTLWNNESGWRWNAYNPSGAHGIPQAMPMYGETMTNAWNNSAEMQIDWGLNYIAGRYGSPSKALNFWLYGAQKITPNNPHWYDQGGVLKPGVTQTVNATGRDEYILTPQQLKAFHTQGMGRQCTNIYSSRIENNTNFNGQITVQAQDPNAMANALKKKARLQALTSPNSSNLRH